MRLIDADVLREEMQWAIDHGMYDKPYDYLAEIDDAPTIDAVEAIRCKDCYHAEDDITHMFCVYFHHKVYEDDYCSNAVERREESEV